MLGIGGYEVGFCAIDGWNLCTGLVVGFAGFFWWWVLYSLVLIVGMPLGLGLYVVGLIRASLLFWAGLDCVIMWVWYNSVCLYRLLSFFGLV